MTAPRRAGATRGAQHPTRAPRVPFALLVTGLIVGGMCALLGLNTASAANELARHDLAAKDAGVAAQVQQAQNDVAASAAPGALGSAAAALGMVPAGDPAFLQVGADGTVRVLGSPGAATGAPVPAPANSAAKTTVATAASAKTTGKSTSKSTTKTSAAPTGKTSARPSGRSTGATPTPPRPTPTPTPTATLPGGPR